MLSKLTGNMDLISEVFSENQYFALPEFYNYSSKDVFVDCGAFVGDTVELYINKTLCQFDKIYAFEPNQKVYNAMEKRVKRLIDEFALDGEQIILEKLGVGNKKQSGFIDIGYGGNSSGNIKETGNSENMVKIISLDEYFKNKSDRISYIKADIEGYEMEMLSGASEIIQKYYPKLSICIYHKQQDFYEIPIFIKENFPEYKMSVRHHMMSYIETVLYCYK